MRTGFDPEKRRNRKEELRSEVSVFLALITVLVASLILSSVELLRTQAARTYLTVAANSAVDSLFSQYHLELWEEYRLLGMEMYAEDEIIAEYGDFLKPYLSVSDAWNWYGLSWNPEGVSISGYELLTDENGAVFEKEVMDYMMYGWTMEAAGLTEVRKDTETMESAASTGEITGELQECSGKALKLQKKLEYLSAAAQEHNSRKTELERALAGGNSEEIPGLLEELEQSLRDVEKSTENVRDSAALLEEEIRSSETELQGRYAAGKMTEENYRQLKEQMENCRAYSDSQSEQGRKLDRLSKTVLKDKELLEQVQTAAQDAEEYIQNWVPEQILVRYDPPKKEGQEPIPVYEEEVLDEQAVWKDTAERFSSYEETVFSSGTGQIDSVLSDQLESIGELLGGNLLKLVLPDADKVNKTERDLTSVPSVLYLGENTNVFNDEDYLLNKAFVSEYAMLELSSLLEEKDSFSKAELEYVLWGAKSDYQNVSGVAAELVGVRTGLNLTYLLSDAGSLKKAGELAVSMTGGAAGTPLVLVATFLILSTWAAGQAVLDTRDLFSGGKVPLIHTKKTFTLSADAMLNGFLEELNKKRSNEKGMEYREYLRLFLYSRAGSKVDYRIMDIIEENIRKEQEDFRMGRLYTAVDFSVSAAARHVFITPGKWAGNDYRLTVNTYYAYSER